MTEFHSSHSEPLQELKHPSADSPLNRLESLQQSVSDAIDSLARRLQEGKSEALIQYLEFLSRFHRYSFNNTILIALAYPEATHVAGFQAWKQLGRQVIKGAKGIPILAPMIRRGPGAAEEDRDDEEAKARPRVLRGFRVVHVFDISQTEGPDVPGILGISGDSTEQLAAVKDFIATLGIELEEQLIPGGALGVSLGGKIILRPGQSDAEATAVLIHEIAHELLHKDQDRRAQTTKTVRETEAEATAYVVCHHLGLNLGSRSSDYIQLYQGDRETLAASLDLIQRTACTILQGILPR